MKSDRSGSLVIHIGVVRLSSEGKKVVSIEYQAEKFEGEKELFQIAAEIRGRWEIQDIALCRRTGRLDLGEAILVAAIAASHRREAFEACEQAVERMRKMVSVKKKEILK
jgi:molybdopterin synthase catalytic subunit